MDGQQLRGAPRGFSIVELLIVMVVVIVALLCWSVYYARRAHDRSHWLTCSTRLNQIHKGLVLFASDFGGSYPIPMDISPETAAIGAQTGNSSANLFSYMIWNTYYSPEVVICAEESNPSIVAKDDYRYGTSDDVDWQEDWMWDPLFSSDFTTGEANSSYAILAPIGERAKTEWAYTLSSTYAVAGDRGPRDGVFDENSNTLRVHGDRKEWVGHIAYNDGHVGTVIYDKSDTLAFMIGGDNLFFADEGVDGSDMWLGVWGDTTETTTTAIWD